VSVAQQQRTSVASVLQALYRHHTNNGSEFTSNINKKSSN